MTAIIVLLTLVTAAVHLSFFIQDPGGGVIYLLNAVGYIALLSALYLPIGALNPIRRSARWTLMGYAALTILAYVAFGLTRHEWTVPLGPVDKLIEVTLIVLLWRQDQAQSAQPPATPAQRA